MEPKGTGGRGRRRHNLTRMAGDGTPILKWQLRRLTLCCLRLHGKYGLKKACKVMRMSAHSSGRTGRRQSGRASGIRRNCKVRKLRTALLLHVQPHFSGKRSQKDEKSTIFKDLHIASRIHRCDQPAASAGDGGRELRHFRRACRAGVRGGRDWLPRLLHDSRFQQRSESIHVRFRMRKYLHLCRARESTTDVRIGSPPVSHRVLI